MRLPAAGGGELKEKVDILEVDLPYRNTGEGTIVRIVAAGVRANIEPLGGAVEGETMETRVCRQDYRVYMRYRPDMHEYEAAFYQLKWRNKRLIIDGPPERIEQWILFRAFSNAVNRSKKN